MKNGDFDSVIRSLHQDTIAFEVVMEDFKTYQAELEIQNEELRESRLLADNALQRFLGLFNSLPLPALVVDQTGIILETNASAADLFGFVPRPFHRYYLPKRIARKHQGSLLESLKNITVGENRYLEAIELLDFNNHSFCGDLYLSHLPSSEKDTQN
ncbi:MAG: hypothetical protein ACXV7F_12820, partial [Methylomonas sp.]